MKTYEIQMILGVPPSTLNDWKDPNHEKHNLALLLMGLPSADALSLIKSSEQKISNKPIMLMSTVNCSIGDKSKHLKLGQIKALLGGKEPSNIYEKYALKTIKTEATKDEIMQFASYYKIPMKKVENVFNGD
jgi:hypothetical protein